MALDAPWADAAADVVASLPGQRQCRRRHRARRNIFGRTSASGTCAALFDESWDLIVRMQMVCLPALLNMSNGLTEFLNNKYAPFVREALAYVLETNEKLVDWSKYTEKETISSSIRW